MRLILLSVPVAVAAGLLVGGRLSGLTSVGIRRPLLAIGGIAFQFVPVEGSLGVVLLLTSFALLLAFSAANLRVPGFTLILVGLALNATVIAANQGMPVTRHALIASNQRDTLQELVETQGSKHHLARHEVLLFLGDVIPIGSPVRQAVSVGDLFVHAGAIWFVVAGMRRPTPVRSTRVSVADAPS